MSFYTLPNLLTFGRIFIIPAVVGLLFWGTPLANWSALALYFIACVTDYFDGWFARARGEVSIIGRFLDPIADKLLIVAVILMLVAQGHITGHLVIAALIILLREILVSGLREFLADVKVVLHVSRLAKFKTGAQMIALGLLIVIPPQSTPDYLPILAAVMLWLASILTLVTGYDYLEKGVKHMRSYVKELK